MMTGHSMKCMDGTQRINIMPEYNNNNNNNKQVHLQLHRVGFTNLLIY